MFTEGTATLTPGATLVLYSDGLVELRGEPLDRGLERLAAATIAAPDEIDALCDAIVAGTLANPRRRGRRHAAGRARWTARGCAAVGDPFPRRRTDLLARQLRGGTWPHARLRSAAVELPGGQQASAAARGVVADTLSSVASKRELDDLLIVVTELVNNAVVHGGAADASERVVVHVAAADERCAPRSPAAAPRSSCARRPRRGARRVRAVARRPALQPLGHRRRRRLLRLVRDRSFAHRRISNTPPLNLASNGDGGTMAPLATLPRARGRARDVTALFELYRSEGDPGRKSSWSSAFFRSPGTSPVAI